MSGRLSFEDERLCPRLGIGIVLMARVPRFGLGFASLDWGRWENVLHTEVFAMRERPMMPKLASLGAAVLGLTLAVGTCGAQTPPDTKEKPSGSTVSDKVKSAVQSLEKGAKDAGEAIRDQYHKMRTAVNDMGVAGRIYGRIHWDKALADAKIDVEVHKDGVATLTGTVSDLKLKAKAVDLTRDTVGVSSVVDKLTISPTTTSETTSSSTSK